MLLQLIITHDLFGWNFYLLSNSFPSSINMHIIVHVFKAANLPAISTQQCSLPSSVFWDWTSPYEIHLSVPKRSVTVQLHAHVKRYQSIKCNWLIFNCRFTFIVYSKFYTISVSRTPLSNGTMHKKRERWTNIKKNVDYISIFKKPNETILCLLHFVTTVIMLMQTDSSFFKHTNFHILSNENGHSFLPSTVKVS
jgi:hypothetical protein